jgi:D-glycero-D-manno-heptose 1,7-bisphosphate phosphatase
MSKRAAFFDRDGTIIPNTGALTVDPDVEPLREAVDAIKKLRAAGFTIIVISNQSGVARGYYTEADLAGMHEAMLRKFEEAGAPIDAVYYCPHHPTEGADPAYTKECDCRKPKPGMFVRAAAEHDIDLGASYMIGDAERDIGAARAAGCKGTAVIMPDQLDMCPFDFATGAQWQKLMEEIEDASETGADAIVPDVAVAATWILEMEEGENG